MRKIYTRPYVKSITLLPCAILAASEVKSLNAGSLTDVEEELQSEEEEYGDIKFKGIFGD